MKSNNEQQMAEMIEVMKELVEVTKRLRGRAFTGIRIPKEREPLWIATDEIQRRALEIIAKATGSAS